MIRIEHFFCISIFSFFFFKILKCEALPSLKHFALAVEFPNFSKQKKKKILLFLFFFGKKNIGKFWKNKLLDKNGSIPQMFTYPTSMPIKMSSQPFLVSIKAPCANIVSYYRFTYSQWLQPRCGKRGLYDRMLEINREVFRKTPKEFRNQNIKISEKRGSSYRFYIYLVYMRLPHCCL